MEADYVVVGAGPAGSVIAAALAAPGRTVALIEEGERREHPLARVPAAALVAPVQRTVTRTISSEPDPTAAGRRLSWSTPRGLCASRALAGLVYARGFARDYDEWSELGALGWAYADVAPVFRRLEDGPGLVTAHGAGGPAALAAAGADHPLTRAFLGACAALGLPTAAGREADEAPHARAATLMLRGARRETPADLWLRPRLRDRELALLTRTRVLSLQLDGRRCIGVFARRDGQDLQIRARAEVILAAGVFGSPKLLMVSGVGPPGLLASVGVAPRHALAGVGANLGDHVGIGLTARTHLDGLARRDRAWPRALFHYLRWRASGRGLFAVPAVIATAWAGAGGVAEVALELTPAALEPSATGHELAVDPGLTLSVHGRRPRSRGRLRPSGAGVDAPLTVEHLMLSDPDELRVLGDGLRFARRLLATAPLAQLIAGALDPDLTGMSDAELAARIRARARPLGHAVGTCRIGSAHDAHAVVDPQLRVHGLQGLRIVDASVMPRVPSESPGAAAIMVAARAAEFIRDGK
jgi:choline dehydrogenase-like flavoprotein